jgi:hypothetical protein
VDRDRSPELVEALAAARVVGDALRAPREVDEILEVVALWRVTVESVEPVLDVGGVRRLRHLAVVDDRHSGRQLTPDDLVRGGLDACGEGDRIDRDAISHRPYHPDQIVGSGEAPGMGAQDAIVVHRPPVAAFDAFPERTVLYAQR